MIQYTRDATWSELRGVPYSDVEEKMERAPRGDGGVNVEEFQGTAGSRLDGLIPNKSKTFPQPPQKVISSPSISVIQSRLSYR